MKAYPQRFVAVLWWVFVLLLVSGFVLLPGMLLLRLGWNAPLQLPSGWRSGVAGIHALLAYGALIVFGALLPLHIRHRLQRPEHRRTGIGLIVVTGLLALSALGIDYLGGDAWSAAASIVHAAVAVPAAALLGVHAALARRRRERRWHAHAHPRHHGGRELTPRPESPGRAASRSPAGGRAPRD